MYRDIAEKQICFLYETVKEVIFSAYLYSTTEEYRSKIVDENLEVTDPCLIDNGFSRISIRIKVLHNVREASDALYKEFLELEDKYDDLKILPQGILTKFEKLYHEYVVLRRIFFSLSDLKNIKRN